MGRAAQLPDWPSPALGWRLLDSTRGDLSAQLRSVLGKGAAKLPGLQNEQLDLLAAFQYLMAAYKAGRGVTSYIV